MTFQFDPNAAAAADAGIFGLPFKEKNSALVYLPVPWEATTSYGGGTVNGPKAIENASRQVDLFDLDVPNCYEAGLFMLKESKQIRALNKTARAAANKVIAVGGDIPKGNKPLLRALKTVNELSEKLNREVYSETKRLLKAGKVVGVIGGDHSVPFGAIRAHAEKFNSFGVLHFDAHSDTRNAYEGFTYSHASIMRNVLEKIPQVSRVVQVGIRDFCQEEYDFIQAQNDRMKVFFDRDLSRAKFEGSPWWDISRDIVTSLPDEVWVSFDIDALDSKYCPHTGTPVPGGLDYSEAVHILWMLVHSGKKIIGFDLNEVSPNPKDKNDEWDGNVGARLLYKLSALTLASQGKATLKV